jgi:hypothetical protein
VFALFGNEAVVPCVLLISPATHCKSGASTSFEPCIPVGAFRASSAVGHVPLDVRND